MRGAETEREFEFCLSHFYPSKMKWCVACACHQRPQNKKHHNTTKFNVDDDGDDDDIC